MRYELTDQERAAIQGRCPRAASPRPQANSASTACDKSTRRANQQNPVHPLAKKDSSSADGQISGPDLPVSPEKRDVAHVTNVAVGCGGRDVSDGRAGASRTAKSCGPGAPTLASSWRRCSRIVPMTVAKEPGHRGEHEVSRKPLRRESRRCSGSPVVLPPCFFVARGPWVQSAPGFPCALCLMRGANVT